MNLVIEVQFHGRDVIMHPGQHAGQIIKAHVQAAIFFQRFHHMLKQRR